ncbi:MAG TPA: ATP-binding protein [Solirubrobacteraceae bacterium]|nr:ATP-binding protein [Solirubrobacteraceae bacterium]
MLIRLELPRDKSAPAAARQAIDELRPVPSTQVRSDARLLVSELVTNSVRHGTGDHVVVLLDHEDSGVLRCEVIDQGAGFVPRARPDQPVGGWGLELVEQIASSWGVREGSTHVWFAIHADDVTR